MKVCIHCGIKKSRKDFHVHPASRDGYQSDCKQCAIKRATAWRVAHPIQAAAASKKWRLSHPDYAATWAKEHCGNITRSSKKWKRANPIKVCTQSRKWARLHPDKVNARVARREAQKLRATPAWTNHVAVNEMYAFAALKTKLTGQPWHVDHIVPLRSKLVCGLHTHYNLQVIPGAANRAKGNRYWPDMPDAGMRAAA